MIDKLFSDANRLGLLLAILAIFEIGHSAKYFLAGEWFSGTVSSAFVVVIVYEYIVNFRPKLKV